MGGFARIRSLVVASQLRRDDNIGLTGMTVWLALAVLSLFLGLLVQGTVL